jgi:outer membrane protein TolC
LRASLLALVLVFLPGAALAGGLMPPERRRSSESKRAKAGGKVAEKAKPLELTIREAVRRGLATAERIQAAKAALGGAVARIGEVRSHALPQVSVDAGFTRTKRELTESDLAIQELATFFAAGAGLDARAAGGDLLPNRYAKLYTAGMGVTQTLFAGGWAVSSIRAARAQADAAGTGVRGARLATVAAVARLYYATLLAEEVHAVRAATHKLAEKHYAEMLLRRKAKAASRFELLRAKVAMQNQEARMISSRLLARKTRLGLLREIGVSQDAVIILSSGFERPGRIPKLKAALLTAAGARPELAGSGHAIRSQRHSVRAAKSAYYPVVTATARWGGQAFQNPFEDDNFDESGYLGLELRWSLFDGLLTRSRVAAARAELARLSWQRRGLQKDVELQVRRALLSLRSALRFIAAQGANVTEAAEALRLADVRHKAGAGTELEVQDARNQLEQAKLNYVRSLYDYSMAQVEYYWATGSLDSVGWAREEVKKPNAKPATKARQK